MSSLPPNLPNSTAPLSVREYQFRLDFLNPTSERDSFWFLALFATFGLFSLTRVSHLLFSRPFFQHAAHNQKHNQRPLPAAFPSLMNRNWLIYCAVQEFYATMFNRKEVL